jgi:dsDNA-specific endonuclease/ATPase MutS2
VGWDTELKKLEQSTALPMSAKQGKKRRLPALLVAPEGDRTDHSKRPSLPDVFSGRVRGEEQQPDGLSEATTVTKALRDLHASLEGQEGEAVLQLQETLEECINAAEKRESFIVSESKAQHYRYTNSQIEAYYLSSQSR